MDISGLDDATREAVRLKIAGELWRRGNLRYKLDETQLKIVGAIEASTSRRYYLLCSRRLGKSYTLLVLCFMRCLEHPGSRVLYLAPWAKDAADIATDIANQIMVDCPADLRPSYNAQAKELVFKRPGKADSIIRFKGTNGEHAQYLRGGAADMVVLDECGLMDDLKHVVNDVVMPMTLTTGGRIFLATTPPRSPGHDSAIIYEELAGAGAVSKFTILDNPRVSDEIKAEFLVSAGEDRLEAMDIVRGLKPPRTTTARREYFTEFVTDASMAVLPEFTKEAQKEIVVASPRPQHFDAYVSMDPGYRDRTGILFAFWDFVRGKLVIEDEILLSGPSTLTIAAHITEKEWELWGHKQPFLRVSDVDNRLIADLHERHRLSFVQAQKQDSLGAINLVRNYIQTREIEINPRCKHLIRQMENALWDRKARDFENFGTESELGHMDLVAALKYLVRSINRRKNPNPQNARSVPDGSFRSPRTRVQAEKRALGLLADTPFGRKIAKKTGDR